MKAYRVYLLFETTQDSIGDFSVDDICFYYGEEKTAHVDFSEQDYEFCTDQKDSSKHYLSWRGKDLIFKTEGDEYPSSECEEQLREALADVKNWCSIACYTADCTIEEDISSILSLRGVCFAADEPITDSKEILSQISIE